LRRAKEALATEKLSREVFRICVLWRMLQDEGDPDAGGHQADLSRLTQSVAKRCRATELEGALQWCESILAAVEGLRFGVDRNASLHLLGQAALSLNQIVSPDRARSAHLQSIEETVATIRARSAGRSEETSVENTSKPQVA